MTEFAAASRTARLIAAAKWRTVRSPASRAWLWVALTIGSGALGLAAQAGDLIRLIAEVDGPDTTAGVVATTYIRQWVLTGFGTLTSAILAFALGTAVISPVLSSSAPTLMPDHHLVGVRTSSMHSFMSALAVHVTSLVTFAQLLALTALAGLLTIDGSSRTRAVLGAWGLWGVLLVVSQAVLWGSRVARKVAPRLTLGVVLAVITGAGVSVLVAPDAAAGLFGAGRWFTWWLLDAPAAMSVAIAVTVTAAAGWAGWAACAWTVRANAVTTPAAGGDRVARMMPAHRTRALISLVVRSFVRTRSICAPLMTITALAAVGVAAAGDQPASVWSVGIGIPVAVGLAWTDNVAAMTGPANSWLASLPGQSIRLLYVWVGWAWLVSITLVAVAWTPAALTGRVGLVSTGSVLLTGAAAGATVTAGAVWHAVRRPEPARTDLGDGILSASRAANASLRLLAVPGFAAWVATSGSVAVRAGADSAPLVAQATGAGLCTVLAGLVIALVGLRWANPRHRALCLAGAS